MNLRGPVLLVLLLLLAPPVRSDEIVLAGGSRLTGVVLDRGESGARLLLRSGEEVRLAAGDIREIVPDETAPRAGKYLEFREKVGLLASVTTLVHPEGGPRVDLVAAVHIADASFYREVQRALEASDTVLYEGIKREEDTAEVFQADDGQPNPIRDLQQKFARWFDLTFQLDEIEYGRPHFLHADLTAEELLGDSAGEGDGGEPGEAGEPGRLPGKLGDLMTQIEAFAPMMEAMFGQPGPMRDNMKQFMARILGGSDVTGILSTWLPETSELLLDRRNAVVVERVRQQLGSGAQSVAVFYGAAHMKGIETALVGELGYRRAGGRWITAWDFAPKPDAPEEK